MHRLLFGFPLGIWRRTQHDHEHAEMFSRREFGCIWFLAAATLALLIAVCLLWVPRHRMLRARLHVEPEADADLATLLDFLLTHEYAPYEVPSPMQRNNLLLARQLMQVLQTAWRAPGYRLVYAFQMQRHGNDFCATIVVENNATRELLDAYLRIAMARCDQWSGANWTIIDWHWLDGVAPPPTPATWGVQGGAHSLPSCLEEDVVHGFRPLFGHEHDGGPYDERPHETLEQCADQCRRDETCVAFDFGDARCRLLDHWSPVLRRRSRMTAYKRLGR